MKIFIPVNPSLIKECQLCGDKVVFLERRVGNLWFPADIIQDEDTQAWGYYSRESSKEVSLLHRCFGDYRDETTINGKIRSCNDKLKVLQEKIQQFQKVPLIISSKEFPMPILHDSPEHQQWLDGYVKLGSELKRLLAVKG